MAPPSTTNANEFHRRRLVRALHEWRAVPAPGLEVDEAAKAAGKPWHFRNAKRIPPPFCLAVEWARYAWHLRYEAWYVLGRRRMKEREKEREHGKWFELNDVCKGIIFERDYWQQQYLAEKASIERRRGFARVERIVTGSDQQEQEALGSEWVTFPGGGGMEVWKKLPEPDEDELDAEAIDLPFGNPGVERAIEIAKTWVQDEEAREFLVKHLEEANARSALRALEASRHFALHKARDPRVTNAAPPPKREGDNPTLEKALHRVAMVRRLFVSGFKRTEAYKAVADASGCTKETVGNAITLERVFREEIELVYPEDKLAEDRPEDTPPFLPYDVPYQPAGCKAHSVAFAAYPNDPKIFFLYK